jgi:putative chromate ion transporter
MPVTLRTGGVALALFLILLVALPVAGAAAPHSLLALAGIFYKAGALVFGGGHVVLPLLRDALVPQGWLSDNTFLAGYGVAQAIPGPLFTFSAYLGAVVAPPGAALLWSAVALIFIFLPGLLIALAGLPVWLWLGHHPAARAALAGINAAVVGVLGAALYNPIWLSASAAAAMSRSLWLVSCCWSAGGCRRSPSWSSASVRHSSRHWSADPRREFPCRVAGVRGDRGCERAAMIANVHCFCSRSMKRGRRARGE